MKFGIFDAHADTVSKIYETNQNLKENSCHTDFERMKQYPKYTQVFAAFVDRKAISESPKAYTEKLILKYKDEIHKCGILGIESTEDLGKNTYSSILSIEGGEALGGEIQNIDYFYNLGVRILTLTWNYDNELCGGIGDYSGKGLSEFGRNVVKRMNEIGMIVDVSHISEKGFWNVAKCSEKPFIASHSNVRKICSHSRNLTDEQIKEIIRQNGVIGVNFYPVFLSEDGRCGFEKIIEHIEYILNLGGENNVGIGSDFDGVDSLPDGITGVEDMSRLVDLMEKRGYKDKLISKILYENFNRVLLLNTSKNI
ncbi:MAG: membrane dipeptidase [Ruminococcaceae bacterium]|nr:membrane dipeptidase [Oscillospiraceae bacterium]